MDKKDFDKVFNKVINEMPEEKFVVYPDQQFSVEELILHKEMSNEKENEIDVKSVKTMEEIGAVLPEANNEDVVEATVEGAVEEEVKELTEEEKKAIYIQRLKESHIRFKLTSHPTYRGVVSTTPTFFGRVKKEMGSITLTNETVTKFGAEYRKKRKTKNKMARASRKANR